jgi:hypothetical protein
MSYLRHFSVACHVDSASAECMLENGKPFVTINLNLNKFSPVLSSLMERSKRSSILCLVSTKYAKLSHIEQAILLYLDFNPENTD